MVRRERSLSAIAVALVCFAGSLSAQTGDGTGIADVPQIVPGPDVVTGALADGLQDLWTFNVPASEIPALFSATVEGLRDTGGALGIIAIERNEAGEVTRRQDVSIVGLRPFSDPTERVARVGPLILAPGDYVLGVTPLIVGEGAYALRFTSETPAPLEDGVDSLPFGLWLGSTGTELECFQLPPERIDVSLLGPPPADLTVSLRDRGNRDQERARIDAGWQIGSVEGTMHDLCLSGRDGTVWVARIAAAATPERDSEPNGTPETAIPLSADEVRTARIDPRGSARDIDVYRILGSSDTRSLRMTASDGGAIAYELLSLDGERLKSGEGGAEFEIAPYLREDDLLLSVTGDPETEYEVEVLSAFAPSDGEDVEPNDTITSATPWSPGRPVRGLLSQDDIDVFRLDLDQPAQLWRLQAEGGGITRLRVYDAAGDLIAERRADARTPLRISGLYMIPGRYSVQIEGEGPYTLRLLPLGPRRDDTELEPNEEAQELKVGQALRGQLDPADIDRFRFTVHASEWLRLRVSPPLGERISIYMLAEGGEVVRHFVTGGTSSMDYTREFWAGDYEIEIKTAGGNSGLDDYTISLEPADLPFGPAVDREPNDYPHSAEDWPEDGRLAGRVGAVQQDRDGYRLSDVASGADLRFCALPEDISISVIGPDGAAIRRAVERTDAGPCEVYLVNGSGDVVVFVEQNSTGARTELPSDYDIVPGGSAVGTRGATPAGSAIAVALAAAPPTPRSFLADFAQHLPLRIEARGVDPAAGDELSLAASEPRWAIDLTGSATDGNGTTTLTAELVAAPDLDEREVRLHLRLRIGDREGVVSFSLTPDADSPARMPRRAFPVPEALLGGLNMAAASLGGTVTGPDGSDLGGKDPSGTRRAAALIDGLAIASNEFSFDKVSDEALFTIQLGGDAPVPLAGLLLTPRAAPGGSRTLRDFRVEGSVDGVAFREVLRATLGAEPVEQAFVFDAIVSARALRLIPETNWTHDGNAEGPIRLGEFKAIATPGWMPLGEAAFNIADPALGGHVAWTDPAGAISRDWDRDVLVGGDTRASRVRDTDSLSLVIGFHHARTARIAAIDWTLASLDLPDDRATPASRVVVSASTEGPLGPWTEVAAWSPPPDAPPESPARLELEEPVWARYLRFDMSAPGSVDYLRLPERLGVFEAPASVDAPSILGEWGEFTQASGFERLTAPEPAVVPAPAGGATAETAVAARTGVWIPSSVQRGVRSDWWAIAPSPERRELQVTLDTARQGGAQPELMDENGNAAYIRHASDAEADARGVDAPLFLAELEGDTGYRLHIEEPLRPIIVVWDTSGSTTPYKPSMQRALRDIALRADPDRDLIGFLPFGGDLLGDGLLGDPELLIRRLGTEVPGGDSSAAETALVRSSGYLARQNGVRGMILITDAATGRDEALWDALNSVRPRIGALAIPSTGAFGPDPDRERDLMETWSRVNGGFYDYVSTQADFTEGFARAVDRMRGPKAYRMRVGFGPAVAQPPGRLRVVGPSSGDRPAEEESALLVLLDTSGSMLQQLDGRRRYRIAFDALAQLGAAANARGIPMGLRRFGIEPGTCDSEVLAPVAPADGRAIAGLLDGVVPQNNARTPLGLALDAAAQDLASASGKRRIVVLTDGEETCGGDPERAIRALADAGIATRIDIVGFAIDNADLSATFEAWATLGNGIYTSSRDAEGLARALLDVTERSYRARASDGTTRAGTVGGGAITLPAGKYELFVDGLADPVQVEIEPDSERLVDLAQ
ncbi:vWA domain-containing protein [Palleronia sp. KMU-117]|uniref:vWA domain-containing protein n=1 Tax=Palleronia sp. KMU-117 TaxID=3434108 RepID=UPI003D7080D7